MASLDLSSLVSESIGVAKTEAGAAWTKLQPFADHEFMQFARNAEFLSQLKIKGTISEEEFRARMNLQRLALNNTLLAIQGIGAVTAQNIVNAVLGLVKKAIFNTFNIVLPPV